MLRRPHDERTPAAADVEKSLTGLELQLAADQIQLLLLGDVETVIRALEVGARIHAPAIEP